MADIDSLEIEISAESSNAAQKVNSLAEALERLKAAMSGGAFEAVGKRIRGVGEGAQQANAQTAQRRQAMRQVAEKVKLPAECPEVSAKGLVIDASATQEIDAAAKGLEALDKISEKISRTKMDGPSIDAGVTAEIESAARQVEELGEAAERTGQVQVEIGGEMPGQSFGISQASLTKGINSAFSGTKLGGKIGSVTNLAQEFSSMSTAANSAGSAAQAAGAAGAGAMAGLAAAIGPVVAALELVKQKFNENKEFLQSDRSLWTDTSWDRMGEGVQNVTAALMVFNPWMEKAIYGMRSLIQPGQELLGVLGSLAESGFQKAGSALQSFAASGFEKAGNAMKSMVSGIGDGLKSVGANVGRRLIQPFASAITTIQKWKASIGRLVFYRAVNAAIRAVSDGIKTGMDNLYQFSQMTDGKFASSMDSLASSANYLSNSLGAMAAPLINAVAPAIDFIISKIVSLINMLGALFAVITGAGSFTQAKKQAVSYGEALGGAGGAAKELQDYVLGIDELNVIKDNAGGGGGGGGGGMGFGDLFEEVPLPDWAKEMQDAINRGDWYGAGEILAEHLNGIIESWNAEEWGRKLGEKINHGLEFALGFLRRFDFDELGGKLAEAINGIGESLDFDTLGRVIGAGWNAVFETANGFFKRLDWELWGRNIAEAINGMVDEINWPLIGQTISNGLVGLFTMADEAIRGIEWAKLGSSLATMLNNINWYGIVYTGLLTILDGIKAAAATVEAFAKEFKWDAVATQISGGINHALYTMSEAEWTKVGASIGLLFTKGFGFARNVISGIDWPQLGRDIAAMLSGVDWPSLLKNAGGALAAGFNAMMDGAYEIVAKESFWAKLGQGVTTGIQTFFSSFEIGKALDGLSLAITRGIGLAIAAINGLVQAQGFWTNLGNGIKTGISNFFNNINPPEVIAAITGLLQRVINAGITAVSELASHGGWWAEMGTAIGSGINDLLQNTDWKSLLTSLAKLATDILNGLTAALKTINWDEAWQTIKEALDAVDWGPLVDAGMGFFAESFKAKMQLKLFEGKAMANIGGNVISEIAGGIIDKYWLLDDVIDGIVNSFKMLGAIVMAVIRGDFGAIPGIIDEYMGESNKRVEFHSGGMTDTMSGAGRRIKEDWQIAMKDVLDETDKKAEAIKDTATGKFLEMHVGLAKTITDIAADVEAGWINTEASTNTRWNSIGGFLNSTWSGLQTAADIGFTAMSTSVKDNWDASEEKTNSSWSAQKATLEGVWSGLEAASKSAFEAMYGTVDKSWTDSSTSTTSNWGEIVTTTDTKAGEALNAVKTNFNQVSGAVTGELENAKRDAKSVEFSSIGTHIANGISTGFQEKVDSLKRSMVAGIEAMKNAAMIAAKINSPSRLFRDDVGVYIGLGLAAGVEDSIPSILSSIYDANDQMKAAFDPNVFPSPEDMSFPVHEDYSAAYQMEYTYDAQHEEDTARQFTEGVRAANEDVINALYALGAQIIDTMNSADNQPRVYLDGKEIMQNTEKHQRQRGANIMGGGVYA